MIKRFIAWLLDTARDVLDPPTCKSAVDGGTCSQPAVDHGYCKTHAKWLRENTTLM